MKKSNYKWTPERKNVVIDKTMEKFLKEYDKFYDELLAEFDDVLLDTLKRLRDSFRYNVELRINEFLYYSFDYHLFQSINQATKSAYNYLHTHILFLPQIIFIGFTGNKSDFKELEDKYISIKPKGKQLNEDTKRKYKDIAELLFTFEKKFKYVNAPQQKACEIVNVSHSAFAKWKNSKNIFSEKKNSQIFYDWYHNTSGTILEHNAFRIKNFLKDYVS